MRDDKLVAGSNAAQGKGNQRIFCVFKDD